MDPPRHPNQQYDPRAVEHVWSVFLNGRGCWTRRLQHKRKQLQSGNVDISYCGDDDDDDDDDDDEEEEEEEEEEEDGEDEITRLYFFLGAITNRES
ncbi:hypothetical protein SprV_0602067600 [Sparganum proliferum]